MPVVHPISLLVTLLATQAHAAGAPEALKGSHLDVDGSKTAAVCRRTKFLSCQCQCQPKRYVSAAGPRIQPQNSVRVRHHGTGTRREWRSLYNAHCPVWRSNDDTDRRNQRRSLPDLDRVRRELHNQQRESCPRVPIRKSQHLVKHHPQEIRRDEIGDSERYKLFC
jgi:hypothetical protein